MKTARRRRPTIADNRMAGTLLGDSHCCWIDLDDRDIDPVPLKLQDGREMPPGAIVTNLGGKRTSAGYTRVRLLEGEFLTYRGQVSRLDGTLAIFDTRKAMRSRVCYWILSEWLCHFTPACSGRVVELTHCEFSIPSAA